MFVSDSAMMNVSAALQICEGSMPYSTLFESSKVKNIWAKVALGHSQEYQGFQTKTSPHIYSLFYARIAAFWYNLVH
jgi:hypothetical protein